MMMVATTGSARRATPILYGKIGNPLELTHIGNHQRAPPRQSNCCYQEIVGANRGTHSFKLRPDLRIAFRCLSIEWVRNEGSREFVYHRKVCMRVSALLRPSQQLSFDN